MTARARGEGTIRKRKDGRWEGRLRVKAALDSKPSTRTVYGATRGEVAAKLAELRGMEQAGQLVPANRLTLGQWLERWLDEIQKPRLRPRTYTNEAGLVRNHLVPHLGTVRLRKLSTAHIGSLFIELERLAVGSRVRQHCHATLAKALDAAATRDLIPKNPMRDRAGGYLVPRPRHDGRARRPFTADESVKLIRAARATGPQLEALVTLALLQGPRLGELLALRWKDLEGSGQLVIERTLDPASLEDGPPKTKAAVRVIELGDRERGALERHRAALPARPHPERRIFTDSRGGPIRQSNFSRRTWHPLLEAAGLARRPFHACRHTCATLALEAGISARTVQKQLGHARIEHTLGLYTDVSQRALRSASRAVSELLAEAER